MRYKKGDPVIVLAGNDKGKEGKIVAIQGEKVVVAGVNRKKKHQKSQAEKKSGSVVTFDAPISISNIAYAHEGKGLKLRARINSEGKKEIYVKSRGQEETVIRSI